MGSKRQLKFRRMIQKEMAGIFQQKGQAWITNNIVSITKVEMSPDLSVAKIYLSFLRIEGKDETFKKFDQHKGEIRRELGNRIGKTVRIIPEIIFYLDEGAAHSENMDNLFRQLHIPPENPETEN